MRDKKYLSTYAWKLIVVVSDHRDWLGLLGFELLF
jgi:hypothetical protein